MYSCFGSTSKKQDKNKITVCSSQKKDENSENTGSKNNNDIGNGEICEIVAVDNDQNMAAEKKKVDYKTEKVTKFFLTSLCNKK